MKTALVAVCMVIGAWGCCSDGNEAPTDGSVQPDDTPRLDDGQAPPSTTIVVSCDPASGLDCP